MYSVMYTNGWWQPLDEDIITPFDGKSERYDYGDREARGNGPDGSSGIISDLTPVSSQRIKVHSNLELQSAF